MWYFAEHLLNNTVLKILFLRCHVNACAKRYGTQTICIQSREDLYLLRSYPHLGLTFHDPRSNPLAVSFKKRIICDSSSGKKGGVFNELELRNVAARLLNVLSFMHESTDIFCSLQIFICYRYLLLIYAWKYKYYCTHIYNKQHFEMMIGVHVRSFKNLLWKKFQIHKIYLQFDRVLQGISKNQKT